MVRQQRAAGRSVGRIPRRGGTGSPLREHGRQDGSGHDVDRLLIGEARFNAWEGHVQDKATWSSLPSVSYSLRRQRSPA